MADMTGVGLAILAGATALHSIPHIVRAWAKRSEAESGLVNQALRELTELRAWRKEAEAKLEEAEAKLDRLEADLAEEKAARSHSDGQVAILQMQLERTERAQDLWEKRAYKMKREFDDLYAALGSSHQGKSLPPRPPDDW